MRFGLELEVAGISISAAYQALRSIVNVEDCGYNHRTMACWKIVIDSSINPYGCEVVSPPLELTTENLEVVAKVCKALKAVGATVNKSTGMHVHVDCTNETNETIANIYNRYRVFESQIDQWHAPSRRGNVNHYCGSLPAERPNGRYYKLNLQSFVKYGTVEFRQHAGSLNPTKVTNWINFCCQFVAVSTNRAASIAVATAASKSPAIINLLTVRGMTAKDLATQLNSTVLSVQSMICRLKKAGVNVVKYGKVYMIPSAAASTAVTESVFRGISASVRAHLESRVSA